MTKTWGRNCLGKKLLRQECSYGEVAQLGSLLTGQRSPWFTVHAGGWAGIASTEMLQFAPQGVSLCLPVLQPARNTDGEEFLMVHPARAFAFQVFLNYFSRQFNFLGGCFLPFSPLCSLSTY